MQQSELLVPILYSLKTKAKKEQTNKKKTQKVPMNMKFSGPHPQPTPASMAEGWSLLVKDTVSSWEQDFVEDHFCHDAPDRPDVHYQIPGG